MHAIQQNKTLFSSVNQPINQSTNPVVASITRKQSINHIHSRKRARVDKELSTRIGQRISRLPAPRARPTPPRARESRATYFFTSPHSRARANPRSSDASHARPCAHAVRSATERVRARMASMMDVSSSSFVRRDAIELELELEAYLGDDDAARGGGLFRRRHRRRREQSLGGKHRGVHRVEECRGAR